MASVKAIGNCLLINLGVLRPKAGLNLLSKDPIRDVTWRCSWPYHFLSCLFLPSCVEALEAELLACSKGLDLAICHSQLPLLNVMTQKHFSFMYIILEIKEVVKHGRMCSFVKIDLDSIGQDTILQTLRL